MAWGIGLVDTLHGHHRHFQQASTKEIPPQQGTPALGSRLQGKKNRPRSLKTGEKPHFRTCRGEEDFTALHSTSRRGDLSFTPAPPQPHKRDKIRPARLHQRPDETKFAQHNQNTPKSAFFRQQGELCLGLTQNPDLLGEFFRTHEHPRFHPRRTLRPQPKPCAACAHATTPVAHWPHD